MIEHEGLRGQVYGLRAFVLEPTIMNDTPCLVPSSPVFDAKWVSGEHHATCEQVTDKKDGDNHRAPAEECRCGVYSVNALEPLIAEYEREARQCLAVVALEGEVIEHRLGYRSERATIVALRVAPELRAYVEPWADRVGAKMFAQTEDMLTEYGVPMHHKGLRRLDNSIPVAKAYRTIAAAMLILTGIFGIRMLFDGNGERAIITVFGGLVFFAGVVKIVRGIRSPLSLSSLTLLLFITGPAISGLGTSPRPVASFVQSIAGFLVAGALFTFLVFGVTPLRRWVRTTRFLADTKVRR